MMCIFIRRLCEESEEECFVTIKAEIEVIQLQAWGHEELLEISEADIKKKKEKKKER